MTPLDKLSELEKLCNEAGSVAFEGYNNVTMVSPSTIKTLIQVIREARQAIVDVGGVPFYVVGEKQQAIMSAHTIIPITERALAKIDAMIEEIK